MMMDWYNYGRTKRFKCDNKPDYRSLIRGKQQLNDWGRHNVAIKIRHSKLNLIFIQS